MAGTHSDYEKRRRRRVRRNLEIDVESEPGDEDAGRHGRQRGNRPDDHPCEEPRHPWHRKNGQVFGPASCAPHGDLIGHQHEAGNEQRKNRGARREEQRSLGSDLWQEQSQADDRTATDQQLRQQQQWEKAAQAEQLPERHEPDGSHPAMRDQGTRAHPSWNSRHDEDPFYPISRTDPVR
jgi:uncharacterized Zn finger protein (UPF0148 family)